MKHTEFDAQIKSSLEHLETEYQPASWDMLRQKMDRLLIEEDPAPVSEIDKAVFHKLQQVEVPYEPAHWDMLAARMNKAAHMRRRIWIGKIAEAAIFLLLLVNLDDLLNMADSSRERSRHRSNSNRPQVDIPASKQRTRQYAAAGQSGDNGTFSNAAFLEAANGSMSSIFTSLASDPANLENAPSFNGVPMESVSNNGFSEQEKWHALATFAALDMRHSTMAPSAGGFRTPYFPVKPTRSSKMYAATFGTYNHNLIHTGNDQRSANGYGGGIAVGYKNGKWAVEAGLTYNQVAYAPKKEIEIYAGSLQEGYLGTYASQIEADVFSFPIKAVRKFAQMGRASIHGIAGVSGNVAVQKSYQYRTIAFGNGPSTQPNPNQPLQPQLSRKGAGLLEENGKLKGNFYATADAGIRVQQPVGKRFTAFVEPVYHQSLGNSGIGPKANRINSFSLNAGVIASL
ncbi:MAG: hypothetical protein JNM22_04020 [Saprospiraceae bacterium]|nr:hypothetical protein [Saprospiraceae bacterium]